MIDRLFDEIIREIVRYAYADQHYHRIPVLSPYHLPPVVASQVCRSWRHTILPDPTMWTCIRIPDMKPDEIKEMLCRSARVPLHVFVDAFDWLGAGRYWVSCYLPETLRLLFAHIRRFETLHLTLFLIEVDLGEELVEQILPYLSHPAPLLQNFCLHVAGESSDLDAIGPTLFSGHAPKLEHVYRQISASFHEVLPSSLFQNLTSLCFSWSWYESRALYFDPFLDVLELSPRLKTFEVMAEYEYHLLDVIPPTSSDRRINLPNLQKLQLWVTGNTKFLDFFINHVALPQTKHCCIMWNDLPYESWSSTPSLQFFIRQYPMRDLSLKFSGKRATVTFRCNCSVETDFSIMYDCYGVSGLEHADSFFQLVYRCDLSNIKEFCIQPEISLNPRMLRTLLASMFNLKLLHIVHSPETSSSIISVLAALIPLCITEETGTEWESGSSLTDQTFSKVAYMLPCASLQKLVIDILDSVVDDEDTIQSRLGAEHASMLRVCSDSRREHGYPFRKITIRVPSLEKDLTEEVKAILEPRKDFPVKLIESTS